MPLATKRRVVGRKIVDVRLNRFSAGGGRGWSYDPVFVLDNGAEISFVVDEIESASDYGVTPHITTPTKQAAVRRARSGR